MTALNVVEAVSKGLEIIPSVAQIATMCSKKESLKSSEKVEVVVEVVFCLLKGVDCAFSVANLASSKKMENLSRNLHTTPTQIALGLSIASGVTDITKTITQKFIAQENSALDILEVVGVVVFRAANIANQVKKIEKISNKDKEIIDWVSAGLNTTSIGLQNTFCAIRIYRNKEKIFQATKTLLGFSKKHEGILVVEENKAPNEMQFEKYNQSLLLTLDNWQELKEIPKLYENDDELLKYKCAISNKPIRFPVRPVKNSNVLYEAATLNEWRANHPNEKPNQWPEDLDCIPKNTIRDAEIKEIIDLKLKEYADYFRELMEKNKSK